jgi:hypothetical protein
MQLDYVVLADAAMAVQGKHYLLGAGWDSIVAGGFPLVYPSIGVAIRLRGTHRALARPAVLQVDIVDEDEESILPNPPGPLQATVGTDHPQSQAPGGESVLCVAFTLAGVTFPRPGRYEVVARVEGGAERRSPFTVLQAAEQPADH